MAKHPEPRQSDASPRLRVDPVLVTATGLCGGALASIAPVATLLSAIGCLALLRARLPWRAVLLAGVAVCAGWGRAAWQLSEFASAHEGARVFLEGPRRCSFNARVTSSPSVRQGVQRFDAEIRDLDCEGRLHAAPLAARLYGGSVPLARGDQLEGIADLGPTSTFRNFLLPDPRPGAAQHGAVLSGKLHALEVTRAAAGLGAHIDALRAHVRARIDANFAPNVRGMARALVLGESDLSAEDDTAFRKSGLSHLLAVSGTHLILAVLALTRAARALLVRWHWLSRRRDVSRLSAMLGLVLAPLYADFAGGSGSAWRAAWMLIAVLGVQALGRRPFPSRILTASLGAGWLSDGLVLFDLSFLLSIAATVGLSLSGALLGETSKNNDNTAAALTQPRTVDLGRVGRLVSDSALTTLAATLPCLPILLLLGPGVTLASVAANLLAAPLGEIVALPLCLLFTLLAPLPLLEQGVALVASGALFLIRGLSHASAEVTWLAFELPPPSAFHIGVLALGASGWLALSTQRWQVCEARVVERRVARGRTRVPLWLGLCALGLCAVEAISVYQHSKLAARGRGLRITALDVGQGDATLIDLPDGRLMLIDGGGFVGSDIDPGQRIILPVLRARRRDHLDIVVLSHPHPDHFGGLGSVVEGVSVGEFWYGGSSDHRTEQAARGGTPPGPHARLLARLRELGVPSFAARELCDRELGGPGYSLQLLAPCPDVSRAQSANDNSLVLRVALGQHAALLTGDAEDWAEQQLLGRSAGKLRASFLKVGHHGSRSSSSEEFLAQVRPQIASISCGLRNRFGHPHAETLATLERWGVRVLRLDLTGSVQWQTDGSVQEFHMFYPRDPDHSAHSPAREDVGARPHG